MGRTIHLEIPPRSDFLAVVRRVVATAAGLGGVLADRRIDDLSLAVSEACANAIDAQRSAGSPDPVGVTIELNPHSVVAIITDHAGGFAPATSTRCPPPTIRADYATSAGSGLPLMRSLAEVVSFTATGDGTAVRIEVHAAPA